MSGLRSSFSTNIQAWKFFIYWVAVGVFQFAAPQTLRPAPSKIPVRLILIKAPPIQTYPPNFRSHPHTLLTMARQKKGKKLVSRVCCMFVFCSFPLVFSHMPSLTKLSVLPEVGLCHHPSVRPPWVVVCVSLMWLGFSRSDPAPNLVLDFYQYVWYWTATTFAPGSDWISVDLRSAFVDGSDQYSILDSCQNAWYWIAITFATGSDRFFFWICCLLSLILSCLFDFWCADLLKIHFLDLV